MSARRFSGNPACNPASRMTGAFLLESERSGMRASIAFVFVLFALTAAAQDQKVVSVWEGYEYRTSDWAHCRRLLEDYLAAVDFRSPLCEYQHIGDLLRDGWIVNHSIPIETEIVHGRTRIEGAGFSS